MRAGEATVVQGSGAARRAGAAAVDVLAVVLFVVIGRASHDHGESPAGIASTLWPFACGLVAGWLLLRATRRQAPSLAGGALVCVATVVVGMALRVVSGQGTAAAFIGVTTGFLGATMLGGRLLVALADRRAGRRRLSGQG